MKKNLVNKPPLYHPQLSNHLGQLDENIINIMSSNDNTYTNTHNEKNNAVFHSPL